MSDESATTRVLIVDDDTIMGELLDALLTAEGYRVAHAVSGAAALQVIRQVEPKPSIILCDIQMPGMRGGELANALTAMRADGTLPSSSVILAMSGSSPRPDELRSFDGLLRKPFSVADFTRAVEQARTRSSDRVVVEEESPAAEDPARKPPVDDKIFEQLRSKVGNDLLRQMYEMTLEDVRARLGRIATAAKSGDEATIRQEAHTIKGSCGMMGALELQALATATEGGSPVDTSALADFDSACQRLQRMLNERL